MYSEVLSSTSIQGAIGVCTGLVLALIWELFARHVAHRLTRMTTTDLDDKLLDIVRRPITAGIIIASLAWALSLQGLEPPVWFVVRGLIATVVVLGGIRVVLRCSSVVLDFMVSSGDERGVVQAATLPLLQICVTVACYSAAIYFVMLAWNVDIRGWLASAGVVGVAVGFAAQDTLANLFAGVFILMDRPYKIGDFLVLESGERGRVTGIGIRTTRLVTRDDQQIIIPNAVMADARIVNESAGPWIDCRIRVVVDVAYGSDLDHAAEVMTGVANRTEDVVRAQNRLPRVRFTSFEDSGIRCHLLCWVPRPVMRERVVDRLIRGIHSAFNQEGIEIPFPQRVLHQAAGTFDGTEHTGSET